MSLKDHDLSTKQLASSTLWATIGAKELIQIFTEKDAISTEILTTLDTATESWGIKVRILECYFKCGYS
jgi:erythrocyte band 7 integral membrane protein